jgi:hypothetical protein
MYSPHIGDFLRGELDDFVGVVPATQPATQTANKSVMTLLMAAPQP